MINHKIAAACAVVSTVVIGFAGLASAQTTPPSVGDGVTSSLTDWSGQALDMWPAALAAGMALFGVTLLIRFGKKVFRAGT